MSKDIQPQNFLHQSSICIKGQLAKPGSPRKNCNLNVCMRGFVNKTDKYSHKILVIECHICDIQ